jgi:hypothetical protein
MNRTWEVLLVWFGTIGMVALMLVFPDRWRLIVILGSALVMLPVFKESMSWRESLMLSGYVGFGVLYFATIFGAMIP